MKRNLLVCLLFFLIVCNVFPEEKGILFTDTSIEIPANKSGVILKIDLVSPKIYRENEEIVLDIKIINKTEASISTFVTDDKRYCFDFKLFDIRNKEVEHSEEYQIAFHKITQILKTRVFLESNEGYSYRVRLNDYYNLTKAGQYYLKGFYYPDLKTDYGYNETVESNQLVVNIRPQDVEDIYVTERRSVEEEKKLNAEKRAPDEVVRYMLTARMNKEWEKFFLYMDLDSLILDNMKYKENYLKLDREKQKEILYRFKEDLKKDSIDSISFLPNKFDIVKTEYLKDKGKVEVKIEFKNKDLVEMKYYTYFLKKKGFIWYIYNYEVMNLGIKYDGLTN